MCSFGSSQVTQSANPTAGAAYTNEIGAIQGLNALPYQPYGGELVAPFNAEQNTGVAGINQYSNAAAPAINQAIGLAGNAAQPITAADINNYVNPYTQQVVNATQAQFNTQNAQAQNSLVGNQIAQGALGGNRSAVAAAQLAGQQQTAQAPVIAGLESSGYQQGVNTALAEQQAGLSGALGLGNLGTSLQSAGLSGATAELGAGTQQQQTQQAQDAAAYQQFLNAVAYPYQQASFQTSQLGALGPLLGGTTTYPAPNILSQIAGLGVGTAGLAGLAGAFGKDGGAINAKHGGGGVETRGLVHPEDLVHFYRAAGGLVHGYDDGGMAPTPWMSGTPYLAGSGYIPKTQVQPSKFMAPSGGLTAPTAPGQQSPAQQAQQIGALTKGLGAFDKTAAGDATQDFLQDFGDWRGGPVRERGGLVRAAFRGGGGLVRRYADGGGDDDSDNQTGLALAADPYAISGVAPPLEKGEPTFAERPQNIVIPDSSAESSGPPGGQVVVPPSAGVDYKIGSGDLTVQPVTTTREPRSGGLAPDEAVPLPYPRPADTSGRMSGASIVDAYGNEVVTRPEGAAAPPSGGLVPPAPPPPSPFNRFKGSLAQSESGGERDPYHLVISTGTGHKVYGKYQIYDDNIPKWTQEALGHPLTVREFLNDPKAQEAVANHKLGEYVDRFGYHGAARAWLAGEGGMYNRQARDRFGTGPYGYADKILARAGLSPSDRRGPGDIGSPDPTETKGLYASTRGTSERGGEGLQASAEDETASGAPRRGSAAGPAGFLDKIKSNIDLSSNSKLWPALMSAGFGAMASSSPFLLQGLGQGAQQGVASYTHAKERETADKFTKARIDEARNRLNAEVEHHRRMDEHAQRMEDRDRYTYYPGEAPDPNDPSKKIPGMYRVPTQSGDPDPEPKFFPGATITGRGGAGSPGGQFKFKYDTYLTNHPGDTQGAEEFASGRRAIPETEIRKWAITAAQKDPSWESAGTQEEKDRLIEHYRQQLRVPVVAPPAATPSPGNAPAPAVPTSQAKPPPQKSVDYLKAHPETAAQFDQKYGSGAAARILAGG